MAPANSEAPVPSGNEGVFVLCVIPYLFLFSNCLDITFSLNQMVCTVVCQEMLWSVPALNLLITLKV